MIALIVIVLAVSGAVVLVGFGRTVRIVPQARAYVVERLGSYSRTLDAGLNTVVPFIDRRPGGPRAPRWHRDHQQSIRLIVSALRIDLYSLAR